MQNLYIVRTATVVSLTAAFVAFGWMSMPAGDDLQIAPEQIAVSSAPAEFTMRQHSDLVIRANPDEPEVHEYY